MLVKLRSKTCKTQKLVSWKNWISWDRTFVHGTLDLTKFDNDLTRPWMPRSALIEACSHHCWHWTEVNWTNHILWTVLARPFISPNCSVHISSWTSMPCRVHAHRIITLCLKKRHWYCTLQLQCTSTDFGNLWQRGCWLSMLSNGVCYPTCPN